MNELLPKKEELTPIKKNTETFYDGAFDADFATLPFVQKLQVVNDIVRQTILPSINSNPEDEAQTMIGNCHTAVLVSISYLQSLGIGKNYRYVLARRRVFDPEDLPTKHAVLLVDDEMGNTFEFDATPFAGYGFGTVKPLKDNPLYEEYIPITGEILELTSEVRTFMYERINGLLTPEKVMHYGIYF